MISPAEIRQKAERLYVPMLRAWLENAPFFPQHIQFRKPQPSDDYLALRAEDDLLRLVNKRAEAAAFKRDMAIVRMELPQLKDWLRHNLARVIEYAGQWAKLALACQYLLEHPRPNLYARELPIPVHTKFIEINKDILRRLLDALLPPDAIAADETIFERRYGLRYDEPLIRLRLLDQELLEALRLPVSDLSAPLSQVAQLGIGGLHCLVVENKLTFLTLPALPGTFAIFGSGFAVELLRHAPWLAHCRMSYWGDLDAQGFLILARLRAFQPHTRSVMMDAATFTAFEDFAVAGVPCAASDLPELNAEEQTLFAQLSAHNLRLEQERIAYGYAVQKLREL